MSIGNRLGLEDLNTHASFFRLFVFCIVLKPGGNPSGYLTVILPENCSCGPPQYVYMNRCYTMHRLYSLLMSLYGPFDRMGRRNSIKFPGDTRMQQSFHAEPGSTRAAITLCVLPFTAVSMTTPAVKIYFHGCHIVSLAKSSQLCGYPRRRGNHGCGQRGTVTWAVGGGKTVYGGIT